MRLHWHAVLYCSSTLTTDVCSIRVLFSVSDLQSQDPEEYPEMEEDEEGNEQPMPAGDVLRAVVSITKVRIFFHRLACSASLSAAVNGPWRD